MFAMFKSNLDLKRRFFGCQRGNSFFLVFLLVSFSAPVFASKVVGDGGWGVDQAASGFRSQEPNVLKNPVLVGSLDIDGNAGDVVVIGNYAYVANHKKGLRIVNVTIPTDPVLVGSLETIGVTMGISVIGSYAYTANHNEGLKIINIAVPTRPVLVSSLTTDGNAYDVVVVGDYAYVAA